MFPERMESTPIYLILLVIMYPQWVFKKSQHGVKKGLSNIQLPQHTTKECYPHPQLEDVPQCPLRVLTFPQKYLQIDKVTFRSCCHSTNSHSLSSLKFTINHLCLLTLSKGKRFLRCRLTKVISNIPQNWYINLSYFILKLQSQFPPSFFSTFQYFLVLAFLLRCQIKLCNI